MKNYMITGKCKTKGYIILRTFDPLRVNTDDRKIG